MAILKKLFLFLGVFLLFFSFVPKVMAQDQKEILLFYGNGCPHCEEVEEFFEKEGYFDQYSIESLEIYADRDNAVLFNLKMEQANIPLSKRGVPTLVMGETILVGDFMIKKNFARAVEAYLDEEPEEVVIEEPKPEKDGAQQPAEPAKNGAPPQVTVLAVLGGSLVDAINPCAFAVLIILMGTVLVHKDKKRALKSGLAFSFSIFLSYFLMGLGLYSALSLEVFGQSFTKIVAVLAIILGLLNIKDWLWYGKGILMEVPRSWRANLKKVIQSVSSPAGAFGVGFLVSLFLLPCTSGPYIVVLGMLADSAQRGQAIFYLLLYNVVFVAPMVVITYFIAKGLDPEKLEKLRQKNLKTLHLIAGLILLAMGAVLLLSV